MAISPKIYVQLQIIYRGALRSQYNEEICTSVEICTSMEYVSGNLYVDGVRQWKFVQQHPEDPHHQWLDLLVA